MLEAGMTLGLVNKYTKENKYNIHTYIHLVIFNDRNVLKKIHVTVVYRHFHITKYVYWSVARI